MNKEEYHNIKRHIKGLCKDTVIELADIVGLNDYETKLLLHVNRTDTRVLASMSLGVCESKFTKDSRKILTKICDYLKRQV